MSDEILSVPISDIDAPDGWNARSGAWHEDAADPTSEDGGFEGLKRSMFLAGRNDEPVLLRPWEIAPVPKQLFKYILVDGYRRLRAAKELGWTTIRAVVEEMTEFEARRRNLAAQAGRIRHKTADLAWGLAELKRLGGSRLTDEELGALVGISGTYAGALKRVMQDLEPKVSAAWRASSVKVAVVDLQKLTTLPREKHWQAWETLVLDSQTRLPPRGKFVDTLRLEKRARELGRTVGELDRLGVLNAKDWVLAIPLLTSRELTLEQSRKIHEIMDQGYHEGLLGKDK